MAYCAPCNKHFNTYNGYNQHINNSAAHSYNDEDYDCEFCNRCFSSSYALDQHCANSPSHPYCASCKRMFSNQNSLMQHMHSRIHVGASIQCPFCKNGFATAAGVTIHLESGTCPNSNMNRTRLNDTIRRLDRKNVITKPMITMPGYTNMETIATERSWNGYGYECYLCHREFGALRSLNNHLSSPYHEQNLYRCPGRSCNREYKLLSGLIQHVESESCGLMKFSMVQREAKNGIENMVRRMITY